MTAQNTAPEQTAWEILWQIVTADTVWIVLIVLFSWVMSIGVTQFIKDSLPDNAYWKMHVRVWAFCIAAGACASLMSLILVDSESWTRIVLIGWLSAFTGVFAPIVYDPTLKRWVWPRVSPRLDRWLRGEKKG